MWTTDQLADYQPNREDYVGEWTIKLRTWNPAFGLVGIQMPDGTALKNVHTSDLAHLTLWELFSSDEGKLKDGMEEEENYWIANIVTVEHGLGSGPNHCGLEIEDIRWVTPPTFPKNVTQGLQRGQMGIWDSILRFFNFID